MTTQTMNVYKYKLIDGEPILISTSVEEIEVISQKEEIAIKEAELLKVYAEIQALKNN